MQCSPVLSTNFFFFCMDILLFSFPGIKGIIVKISKQFNYLTGYFLLCGVVTFQKYVQAFKIHIPFKQ